MHIIPASQLSADTQARFPDLIQVMVSGPVGGTGCQQLWSFHAAFRLPDGGCLGKDQYITTPMMFKLHHRLDGWQALADIILCQF